MTERVGFAEIRLKARLSDRHELETARHRLKYQLLKPKLRGLSPRANYTGRQSGRHLSAKLVPKF
jgi:hypothetical protein